MSRSRFVVLGLGGMLALTLAAPPAGADPITQSPVNFDVQVPLPDLPADCDNCDPVVSSPTFVMFGWSPLAAPPTGGDPIATQIPEPAALALLAMGAGWALARRARN